MTPQKSKYHFALGTIFFATSKNNYEYKIEALKYFKKAAKLNPKSVEAHYHIGLVYQSIQDYQGALETFKRVLKLAPYRIDCVSHIGAINYLTNDFKRASRYFKRVLQADSNHPEANYYTGLIHYANEKYDLALKYLKRAKKYGESADLDYYLGLCYHKLGKIEKALTHYFNAASSKEPKLEMFTSFALALEEVKDYSLAKEQWALALEIDPVNHFYLSKMAEAMMYDGQAEVAVEIIKEALDKSPTDMILLTCISKIYSSLGENELAEKYLNRANTYNTNNLFNEQS